MERVVLENAVATEPLDKIDVSLRNIEFILRHVEMQFCQTASIISSLEQARGALDKLESDER